MDKNTLSELIGKMPKKNLIELIDRMIRFNNQAEQELLDYCQALACLNHQNLIKQKQLVNHWNNTYQLIELSDTYGGCSEEDEGTVYEEMNIIMDLVRENKLSWECRKEVLDEMLKFIASDNSGFTDVLVDCAMEICSTDIEQEYFADHLSKLDSNYYRGVAANIFREHGREEKFLKTQKSNLVYGSDYLTLSEYYEKKGFQEEALRYAWQGLKTCPGRLDELFRYLFSRYTEDEATLWKLYEIAKEKKWNLDTMAELMYVYFKEIGQYYHQKNMLLELVQCCDSQDIGKWYKTCKMELSPEDWNEYQTMILKCVEERNRLEYMKICLESNKKSEVLEYLQKQPVLVGWNHLDNNHCLSKQLIEEYPDDIAALYWREVRANLDQKNKKGYSRAVSVLKEIRNIMCSNKKEVEWHKMYSELLVEHNKKRLLLQIINEKM